MKKKRIAALVCTFLMLVCLLPGSVYAAEDPYFIAINDSLPALTSQVTPIRVGGITYLPYTLFDSRVTGVDFGVYYGQDRTRGTMTLYNNSKILEFNIAMGTAYGYSEGETYSYQAVNHNGIVYVPAVSVCHYFGLSFSFLYTDYGPMFRIKNGREVLNDTMFISSAVPILENFLNKYQSNQNVSQGSSHNSSKGGKTTPKVSQPEGGGQADGIQLTFAFQVVQGEDLTGILSSLNQYRVKAIFFFRTEDLPKYDNTLRELVSEGHRVGLIPCGNTAQEQLTDLQEGNQLLEHILRQNTWFVLSSGNAATRNILNQSGYLCWTAGIQPSGSNGNLYQTVIQKITANQRSTRLLLNDGAAGSTLSRILNQLKTSQYEFRTPKETNY